MASHLASLWKWDFLELGNGLLHQLKFTCPQLSLKALKLTILVKYYKLACG